MKFEEGMQELEEIICALEEGKMPLEDSFKAYERAMQLKDELEKILTDGEARIMKLVGGKETEMKVDA